MRLGCGSVAGAGESGWVARSRKGGVVLCVCCDSGLFVKMAGPGIYIFLGRYLHIIGVHSVQSCCTLYTSASYRVLVCGRYCKSRLACIWFLDLD